MKKIPTIVAGCLAGAAVLTAGVLATGVNLSSGKSTPATVSFQLLSKPQTAADRHAQSSYKGASIGDLSQSHVLATDSFGRRYLLTPKSNGDLCLIVVKSADSAAVGCNASKSIPTRGLWFEFGDQFGSYIAMAIPDQYSNAVLSTTGNPVIRTSQFALVHSHGRAMDRVSLTSSQYKTFTVNPVH